MLIVLVFLLSLLWPYIKLPFDTSITIQGEDYLPNLHNPLNDSVRFFLFISLPLGFYFFYKLFFYKFNLYFFLNKFCFNIEDYYKPDSFIYKNKDLSFYSLIIIFTVLLQFFSLDFGIFISEIDMFHEGLWLTASSNSIYTNEFWQSSYVARGLFGSFYNYFLWKITNINSIGLSRFFPLLITLCCKILLIFIAKSLAEKNLMDKTEKNLFFIILSFLLINLFSYDITANNYFRLFLLLFFCFLLLNYFKTFEKKSISFVTMGLLSSTSMFWFIDIGFFINFLIIFFLIFLLFKKQYLDITHLIFYIILGWFFWYTLLPEKEFSEFITNTFHILTTIEYIGGLIYPTPFFSNDARSTRALLIILITGIWLVNSLFKKNHKITVNTKLSLIFLFIASCISFKIALNRSDTTHIKAGIILAYIPFYYFVIKYLIRIIKKIFTKKKFKNFFRYTPILTLIFFIILNFTNDKNIQLRNIPNFFTSVDSLIYKDDFAFIDKDYQDFIVYYNKLSKKDKCTFIFTKEIAIPYFLKKPTCSKFYTAYTSSPENLQNKFVSDISAKKPVYIVYEYLMDGKFKPNTQLHIVKKYILQNYSFFEKFNKWIIYRIN